MASSRSLAPVLAASVVAGMLLAERRWPLRNQCQPSARRVARNFVLGALSMAVVAAVEGPMVRPAAQRAETRRRGLVQRLPVPAWARDMLAFAAMDYTIYVWHVLTHKVPALWRLHLVHHIDLDLDASTALRFHAVDMLVSAPYRLLQVMTVGASPRALRFWQAFFFGSILFHHSNLRLPGRLERALARVITTHACTASTIPPYAARPTPTGRAA